MDRSIPKGSSLEFINLTPLNPLISRCEVKVLYTGKNRNNSFISKEVATRMANSLPGTPIVGEYFFDAQDFGDHGVEDLVIDEHGARFIKDTVPYGFVPPNAKVWWQDFLDADGVSREYLLTEGYLWTGRYPECKRVVENGNNQSMELDRNSLIGEWGRVTGEWAKSENGEPEYFIITDATFTALCILGENVEPCFEGANITKNSNLVYSLDKEDFKDKMLDFMLDFKEAINSLGYEGGEKMENVNTEPEAILEDVVAEEDFASKKKKEEEEVPAKKKEEIPAKKGEETPAKEDKEVPAKEDEAPEEDKKKEGSNPFPIDKEDEEEKKKKKKNYSLEDVVEYQELLVQFSELQGQMNIISSELNSIKPEYSKLREFKSSIEAKDKDVMIDSFYMLSDEDKKEISDNKANFSLEDIESKLSVICVRKKVNFDLGDTSKNEVNTETPITTFNVDNNLGDSTPAWLKAVDSVSKNRK